MISLITATYNNDSTLLDTFESVGRQTVEDLQYIVIDGGSNDATASIIDDNAKLIDYSVSEPDEGVYDALNKGIGRASGDIVGFIHADDFLADETVLATIEQAFADPEVLAVYGDLEYVSATNTSRVIRYWRAGEFSPRRLRWGWMPPHPTLYLRKRLYEEKGNFNLGYRIAADYECILRLLGKLESRQVIYVPHVLVRMRVGGISNLPSNILAKSCEDLRALRSTGIGGVGALVMKNLSKLTQFFRREKLA